MQNKYDSIVIGGGAAGTLAACVAAERGRRVLLLEPNRDLGRKLRITGKGRCNLTNFCDIREFLENVPCNGKFLHSALNILPPKRTVEMFEQMGLPLKTERGSRVFPVSDDANDVAKALERRLKASGAETRRERAVGLCAEDGVLRSVQVSAGDRPNGGEIFCESALVATGGASYPATGSGGDGYTFARSVGHTIIEPRPSLAPLVENGADCQKLMGLSLKNVRLTAYEDGAPVYAEQGELLFTHFGLSGPLVLSASAHMRSFGQKRYEIGIDLKPALNETVLDERIRSDFSKLQNSDFINALGGLLPRKLIPVVVERSGIDPHTKVHSVTREQRMALLRVFKDFRIAIRGSRPIDEAIITRGGVDVKEIDPRTMRSKLVQGLFFAGEVLNVDAYTGGFNLQIAWSTGYVAGMNM